MPKRKQKTEPSTPKRGATVSAPLLAAHFGCSRQYIARLVADGVIEQVSNGRYDQDQARLRYLQHLRRERRASGVGEAQAEHVRAKTQLLELKVAERARVLMQAEEHFGTIDAIVGLFRTSLGQLPARVAGRDLSGRRRIESICSAILQEISDEAGRRAAEFSRDETSARSDQHALEQNYRAR